MPLRAALRTLALVAALASVATACASAPKEGFDGSVYKKGQVAFRVPPLPPTWKAVTLRQAALSFRDAAHDASILVNARCGPLDHDTPLVALTSHLLIGTTERDVRSQEVEPLDGREALHTQVVAKLDGVPLWFDMFVLKKDGCVYDFVYFAPVGKGEGGAEAFRGVVRGFQTLAGSGSGST